MTRILKLPLLVVLTGIAAIAMLLPMAHAVRLGDFLTARIFLQYSILILLQLSLVGVASSNWPPARSARTQLAGLLMAFVFLPLVLALPFSALVPSASFFDIYFEMLSCLTTTGATIFDDPTRLSDPLHLWRAVVGWLGGLLMWVSAIAIMAPLSLGGYEILQSGDLRHKQAIRVAMRAATTSDRLIRHTRILAPIYLMITLALILGLVLSGERFLVSVVHAMATVSTSGISSVSGQISTHGGFLSEALIFLFLMFAVTRSSLPSRTGDGYFRGVWQDREFRLMLIIVISIPLLLFMRHLFGAFGLNANENFMASLHGFWGAVFTVLSFLTTTGFTSQDWGAAQVWSGLSTPGLMLMGLAIIGGGVATTAGGVKLFRIYALYKHGIREMQKLSFPASVGGAGRDARRIRREGAYLAWIFFMLFTVSAAAIMLGLSLSGIGFENSIILSVATLSTTGPLAAVAGDQAISYAALAALSKVILCVSMILGRFEVLGIIALMNPDFWRK